MTYREYLRSIGMTDDQIKAAETAFGPDLITKAFEGPLKDREAAMEAAAKSAKELEDWNTRYNDEILPQVGSVYRDAINERTKNAALEARLKAATEYGFLADTNGVIPGAGGGQPVVNANAVPGSPSLPGVGGGQPPMDPRYVDASKFSDAVNSIPDMLGRLTKMSNEHFSLFGTPLLDVDTLITEARNKKRNVIDMWSEKYKVPEKRAEIELKKQQDHDRQISEEAVRKYASEHGQPFTRPGIPSVASRFTPQAGEDVRKPWKGARERVQERHNQMLDAWNKTGQAAGKTQ
jgi:hypothetical protein